MKIIKYGIVAMIGAFLLPAPPEDEFMVSSTGQKINLETGEVLAAAASTYSDVSNFCVRQTAVCSTAGQVWTSLENKAKYNFQRVYEWSNGTRQDQLRVPVLPPMPRQQISQSGTKQPNGAKNRDGVSPTQQVSQLLRPNLMSQTVMSKSVRLKSGPIVTASIYTGSMRFQLANANPTNKNTENTLQIEDLIPEWRGPASTGTG